MIRLSEGMARLYCQDEVSEVKLQKICPLLGLDVIQNSKRWGISNSKLFKGKFLVKLESPDLMGWGE